MLLRRAGRVSVRPACYDEAMQTNDTVPIHDELAAQLGAPRDAYRIEQVLKSAPGEVTQLVWLRTAAGGELGPYVRKIIDASAGIGNVYQQLYEREKAGVRYLQLPRIVSCELNGGKLVVVMERVPGPTLREVAETTPSSERLALARCVMPAICDAAHELHTAFDQPVIHRDLTPSNIICPKDDHALPVLIDLGIARTWHEGAEKDTVHLGTRAYAPPEQYGFGQTDVRSDVYALGMLAFSCLTGCDPEPRDRERGFADPRVPDAWLLVIARACALDPADRYATAADLAAAFRTAGEKNALPFSEPGAAPEGRPLRERLATMRRVVAPVRCVAVAAAAAVVIIASVYDALTPAQWVQGSPALNLYSYFVFVPALMLAAVYVLVDRAYLRERFAWLGNVSAKRANRIVLGVAVLVIVIFFLIVYLQV